MDIFIHPNPALKQHAVECDPTTDGELEALIEAMGKAMYAAPGCGLAATQVGVLKRVIVFDVDEGLVAVCNPVITSASEETAVDEEGCLSLPGISVPVERPTWVRCEGLDPKGEKVVIEGEGHLARVLQHETDHLDGILIIDRATPSERRAAVRRYREQFER